MVWAVYEQGLHRVEPGNPGYGKGPSVPMFVIPKTDEECSFQVNYKVGPCVRRPGGRVWAWYVCTFTKGTTQRCGCRRKPGARSRWRGRRPCVICGRLPFWWRLSPPVCEETTGHHVARAMEMMMPRRLGFAFDSSVPYAHYFDDLFVIPSHFHSVPYANGPSAFWDSPAYTQ